MTRDAAASLPTDTSFRQYACSAGSSTVLNSVNFKEPQWSKSWPSMIIDCHAKLSNASCIVLGDENNIPLFGIARWELLDEKTPVTLSLCQFRNWTQVKVIWNGLDHNLCGRSSRQWHNEINWRHLSQMPMQVLPRRSLRTRTASLEAQWLVTTGYVEAACSNLHLAISIRILCAHDRWQVFIESHGASLERANRSKNA